MQIPCSGSLFQSEDEIAAAVGQSCVAVFRNAELHQMT